jgi:DNA-binding transcriptional LysR family regulator
LGEAHILLSKAEQATQRVLSAADGRTGELRVGYLTSMTNEQFSGIMTAFRTACPDVELTLNDLVPVAILAALRLREIDVGFFRGAFRDEELASREIWRDPLVAALPRKHWLGGRGPIAPRSLREETFIMVPDSGSMGLNEAIRTMCLKAGFAPRRRIEANQLQAAIWLVHLGFGVSIVPVSLRGLLRENVVYQPIRRAPVLPAYMVWRKDNESPVLKRFLDVVRETI